MNEWSGFLKRQETGNLVQVKLNTGTFLTLKSTLNQN